MGMLMHHTWLDQQKKQKVDKPKVSAEQKKQVEKEEPSEEPAKRGRRKTTK